jgi:hypothetical protein
MKNWLHNCPPKVVKIALDLLGVKEVLELILNGIFQKIFF